MQFAMRGGRAAVGHLSLHLCSDHHTRSTASPCCSPHSSLPDAGTEPVIRRLASAVARDAVPDPKGGRTCLAVTLCISVSISRTTEERMPAYEYSTVYSYAPALARKQALTARPRRLAQNPRRRLVQRLRRYG